VSEKEVFVQRGIMTVWKIKLI